MKSVFRKFLLMVIVFFPFHAFCGSYKVIDLGTLGQDYSRAYGINNKGQAVGYSKCDNIRNHAFLWDKSAGIQDLGTFGGTLSRAYAINSSSKVVGFAYTEGTTPKSDAFIYDVSMEKVWNFNGNSYAYDINNEDQIVGHYYDDFNNTKAFLVDPLRGLISINTLGGSDNHAYAINDFGYIVGESIIQGSLYDFHAYLYHDGIIGDLGTLGGRLSVAYDINNSGSVVGKAQTGDGYTHAFIWNEIGGMFDLGTVKGATYSEANSINDVNQVVGWCFFNATHRAFYYDEESGMLDLNDLVDEDSGWHLLYASGINNSGQIVGLGYHDNEYHAYLLNPVPLPSAIYLLSSGLLLITTLRKANWTGAVDANCLET